MFVLFLIVNTYQFTIPIDQVACQCSDIPQQDVCTETKKCVWQDDSCNKMNCTQATDQEWCDVILPNSYKCVWNKGKCQLFTKCSDYIVQESEDCFDKWFCIEGGITANGQIQCQDNQDETDESEIVCSSFTKDDDCIGDQSDGSTCIWESTQCVNKTLNSCQDAPEAKYCDGMSCYWDEDKKECDELSCETFQNEDDCNIYYSFDRTSVTQCMWNATECIDYNLIDLNPTQCLNMTLNTYVWNAIQSRCVQCAINKILIFFYLMLLLLLL